MSNTRLCKGCGTPLSNCGSVGLACLENSCSYELDQAMAWQKEAMERRERAELARLKEKYEGGTQ